MRKINDKKSPDNLLTLWWLEQSRADPLHVFFHTRTTQFQLQISNKTNPVKPLSHHVLHVFPLNSHTWQISMFDAQTIAQHLKTPMFSGFHPPFSMVNHGETHHVTGYQSTNHGGWGMSSSMTGWKKIGWAAPGQNGKLHFLGVYSMVFPSMKRCLKCWNG